MPYSLSQHIDEIQGRRRPFGWRLFGWVFYGLTAIALATAVLVVSVVALQFRGQLAEKDALDDCNQAFGRNITETQNRFLTDGFGGLLVALTDETPDRRAKIDASLGVFRETLEDSQAAVAARANWVREGEPLPCPVG